MKGLEEVLVELAQLLPDRLQVEQSYWMVWQADRRHLNLLDGDIPGWLLEYALREEIEARRWGWKIGRHIFSEQEYSATVQPFGAMSGAQTAYAPTAAHALALALLQALAPAQAAGRQGDGGGRAD